MTTAMKGELDHLFTRGTFKIVIFRDPSDKNIHRTKFMRTIKLEDGTEFYKARFLIGGHRDRWNINQSTATSQSQTIVRLLLAIASILDWPIWTTDVRHAYLQSASLLRLAVFLNPNGISLSKDEFLDLMLPPYGLSELMNIRRRTLTDPCLDDCHLSNVQLTCLSFSRGKDRNWSISQPHMSTTFCGLLLLSFAPSCTRSCDQDLIANNANICS
jgi:hypothetical protein